MSNSNAPEPAIRVLLIAPSLDILGGQAVQATRLMSVLGELPGLRMTFFPINPRPPKALLWVRRIPYLRTLVTFVTYTTRLAFTASQYDILHIFSAGLSSYTLWTIPALLFGRFYRRRLIVNYRDGQAEQHVMEWRSALPTLRLADRIVTPSGFLVDVFAARPQSSIDLQHHRYHRLHLPATRQAAANFHDEPNLGAAL